MSTIIHNYMTEYDNEAVYFEEEVRNAKRKELELKALKHVEPAHHTLLGHLRSRALENFKKGLEKPSSKGETFAASVRHCIQSCMTEFDQGCADAAIQQANWDTTKVRDKLRRDIDAYAASIRGERLSELKANFEKRLTEALSAPVESLLEASGKDTWASIRKLLRKETNTSLANFQTALSGFELDQATYNNMVLDLQQFARSVVEKKAKEEAGKVLIHMKDRFSTLFGHDNDSMPRVWTGNEDIRKITKDARAACLKHLAILAAIRLEEKPDKIENILFSSLVDGTVSTHVSQERSLGTTSDPLASNTWEEVPANDVLITPVQCKSLWRQFKTETEYTVSQAISAQEAYKRSNNWLPPPWAILAMIILGFNEFMLILKNPLYLLAIFVTYLLSKAIWAQLDVAGEFQNGTLAGLLSISTRFLPTVMNLLRRLAEEATENPNPQPTRPPMPLTSHNFRSETSTPASTVSSVASSEGDVELTSPQPRRRQSVRIEDGDHS